MKAPWWLLVCALFVHLHVAVAVAGTATTEGRLVVKHDGKPVDIPLEHTDVRLQVDAFLVDATVTQRFKNPYADKIEAVYLFPLPTGAAITELTITIGGRTIHGDIHERAQAKQIYEAARKQGFVAALLTEERPNLFTQSIANLEPGATIEVTLRYVERLAYDNGGYEVVFPMVAGPRYAPGAPTSDVPAPPAMRSSHNIAHAVELDAGVPIEDVSSPSHRIALTRPAPSRAAIHLAAGDTVPNKDFILRYRVAGREPTLGVVAHRDTGEGSFLLVAQPPAATAGVPIAPRELVFVLDTSSSMRGAPLAKAKDVIRGVLGTLRADDTFQIVRFDDRASALGAAPIANKPRNVQLTLDWLAKLDAGGGTEMATGLDAALAVPHDPARLRIVALLTDGYIGNEDAILASVGAQLGDSRVFCFGVGSAVNRYLLEELAAIGRGTTQVVRPDEDTATAVAAFQRRIDAPVLTDIHIDWAGLGVTDVVPQALPDLFLGQPLAVTGHYAHAGAATAVVSGKLGGHEVRFEVRFELPERAAANPAIATVWARQRIAELSRRLVRKADSSLDHEILQLALEHHLLTKYTAFVAVDDARVTRPGDARRVVVPVEVPDAVRDIEVGVSGGLTGYGDGGGGGSSTSYGMGTAHYATIGSGASTVSARGAGVPAAHIAAVPAVSIGTVQVQGQLDKSILHRYVHRNYQKLLYCYEKRLVADPTLAGIVTAQFVIDDHGVVMTSTADGFDVEVASCVADVIKDIQFPSVRNGGSIQIKYPFNFRRADSKKETTP